MKIRKYVDRADAIAIALKFFISHAFHCRYKLIGFIDNSKVVIASDPAKRESAIPTGIPKGAIC
jgi:hypothetical protein